MGESSGLSFAGAQGWTWGEAQRYRDGMSRYRVGPPFTKVSRLVGEVALGSRILDVGPGAGDDLEVLRSGGSRQVVGLDVTSLLREGSWPLVLGSGLAMPFRSGVFDTVVCNRVIHHLSQPEMLFAEVSRVLVPDGGRMVVAWPDRYETRADDVSAGEILRWAQLVPGVDSARPASLGDVLRFGGEVGLLPVESRIFSRRCVGRDALGYASAGLAKASELEVVEKEFPGAGDVLRGFRERLETGSGWVDFSLRAVVLVKV